MTERNRFLLFLVAGGTAAAVNWSTRILLSQWLALGPSIVLAHLAGMVVAYAAGRRLVFRSADPRVGAEFARFGLVNVVSLAQTWVVTVALAALGGVLPLEREIVEAAAHGAAIASTALTGYAMHRRFTFALPSGGRRP